MRTYQLLLALLASSTTAVASAQLGTGDCFAPTVIAGSGYFPYDNTTATTGTQGQTQTFCHTFGVSGISNDLWFEWTASATGQLTVQTCATSIQDTKIAAYLGSGCPTPGSLLVCNDDLCALQSEISFPVFTGTVYTLQIGNFPGAWGGPSQLELSFAPHSPGTPFCFCDAGNSPCGNDGTSGRGCGNSYSVGGANLTGSGLAASTLVLSATGLPPGQPGLYFQGDSTVAGGLGGIFGDGLRCVGQNVIRLGVVTSDPLGNSDTSGFTQPIATLGGVTAGNLKHYQLWYRDPVASPCGTSFNLTNGYSIP